MSKIETTEQFVKEYGKVKVKFYRYYKYTFTYMGVLENGDIIFCDVGGNHDDIYRDEVVVDQEEVIGDLHPFAGTISRNRKQLMHFYDY